MPTRPLLAPSISQFTLRLFSPPKLAVVLSSRTSFRSAFSRTLPPIGGDTVSVPGDNAAAPLPGYRAPQRMVYCGLYPSDGENFEELRDSLGKLAINDPSFEFTPETSEALGFGFRCGFLGLLHMEIIQQRLEQEADLDLVQTAPNVTYQITTKTGETLEIHNPQDVPDSGSIEEFRRWLMRSPLVPANKAAPTSHRCKRSPFAQASRSQRTWFVTSGFGARGRHIVLRRSDA